MLRNFGKSCLASLSSTVGAMMTSSPGTQLIGVVTFLESLSLVCRESTTRRTSAVFLPQLAGYVIIKRIVLAGSMMKTERMVNWTPLSSILVASWWSIMSYKRAIRRSGSAIMGKDRWLPVISSMSLIHKRWESASLALNPIILTPLLVNSGSSFANAPSSVVHTGVKSSGWENSIHHDWSMYS